MAVVYRHIRLDKNEVFYIGIGKEISRTYEKTNNRNKPWNVGLKEDRNVKNKRIEKLSIPVIDLETGIFYTTKELSKILDIKDCYYEIKFCVIFLM